ncbi:cupin [Caulobacter sp. CCUG 60055]|uniref:cupin n=1 Tax=Caulobacter sp. CCUG 60055 TaxID=2100090 RepID=UPI001FA7ED9D|nr:cupin [Caulobacter sp. CCUG 60055]MCI3178941.1 cupin [Caulobacter sp. CCUG 60055]
MKFVDPRDFTGSRAWEALDIAEIDGATVRLHWADRPYDWHANDGDEVFVVLDGAVDMHFRDADGEHVRAMAAGDIFYAGAGVEHVAHPAPEARILVIERKGSV